MVVLSPRALLDRLLRLSLTTRFALLSIALVTCVVVVLQVSLAGMIERRARAQAEDAARFVTSLALNRVIEPADLGGHGLDDVDRAKLDEAVRSGLQEGVLARVKVMDVDGTLVYASDGRPLGQTYRGAGLRAALDGRVVSEFAGTDQSHASERELGRLLEVFVPLVGTAGAVVGVAELYVPYEAVEQGVADDTRRLVVLLLLGLGVLWLVLFRMVDRASQRLLTELARNEHQALHDALTGLPNRTLLFDRTERALALSRRAGGPVSVLLLDLDRFKEVNDTLGHHNGDRLLCQVAERMAACLREADTLARLGGDEFAVLLPGADTDGAAITAQRLVDVLAAPVELDGLSVVVGASVGIATAPQHGATAGELLQRSDVAMYTAKEAGGHVATYSADRDTYSADRLALLGELRSAAQHDQLVLHFQPKSDVRSGRLVGFEALLRWQHPTRGLVPPDVFIPLAEHTGLIDALTPWVLERALSACASWPRRDLSVAVNVSVRNLADPEFPDVVAGLVARAGVAPQRVVLEITETALMADPEKAMAVLSRLKQVGVRLSIDDYGSGYSSLSYLQQLPVDELKIDRVFVRHIAVEERDRAIVRSTVELGKSLGLNVVAEGVEDPGAWDALAGLACDQLQGYFLCRPMPEQEVGAWVTSYASPLALSAPA
ncbi:MAG: EAL domain-containing protein [Actinomycetota bacterium]|nr:EAL domain-containing protein [Actinomycetota bacterium]